MSIQVTIDLVVTRHRPLVELLLERGLITTDTPVLEHAKAEDVKGKHVLGVIPHWLSSLAASVTEVPMRLTQADREAMTRGDLGIERLREVADPPVTYCVEQMSQMPCGGRVVAALATAIKHARGPNGYAIKFLTNDHAAIIEIEDVDGWWRAQVDLYNGAVRLSNDQRASGSAFEYHSTTLGPWLDPMTGEPWQMYRINEDGQRVACMGYPTDEVEAKLAARQPMILGLVRGAEMIEQRDGGSIWDDQVRNALVAARQLGWGAGRNGCLSGVELELVARDQAAETDFPDLQTRCRMFLAQLHVHPVAFVRRLDADVLEVLGARGLLHSGALTARPSPAGVPYCADPFSFAL